ncbi:MAG: NUDIX domain-containing protein [Rickettsiales bacterium]|jgi:isopentenyldiphosphate isomerase|nr:NUDIX domain-containing protein [Rickettsiales bacterium]
MLKQELLDYYDSDNKVLLGQVERCEAKRKGLWVRCFECMIIRPDGKLLYQLRASKKPNSPNKLTISAGGHLSAGETLEQGARELKEELGIDDVNFKDLKYIGWYRRVSDAIYENFGEYHTRTFSNIFLCKDGRPLNEFKIQEEELDGIFEIDMDDLKKMFKGQIEGIKIVGLIFDNKREKLIKNERFVKVDDFTRSPHEWLKLFNCIEDYNNGREDIYI